MWWRALGVAVVLLCVGVAGGYAVADLDTPRPVHTSDLGPVAAESPAVPTTPPHVVLPDPYVAPLERDVPLSHGVLRPPPAAARGAARPRRRAARARRAAEPGRAPAPAPRQGRRRRRAGGVADQSHRRHLELRHRVQEHLRTAGPAALRTAPVGGG